MYVHYAHMVMVTDIVTDMVMCDEYELMLVREGGAADDARLHRHRVVPPPPWQVGGCVLHANNDTA